MGSPVLLPPRRPGRPGPGPVAQDGFTLVEVAVVIGVALILAGTFTPMALRLVEIRRENATRSRLRQMWEAMFGSRDQNLPNMRSDFGFVIIDQVDNLGFLVSPDLAAGPQPPRVRPFAPADANRNRSYGWRGPYWHGPVVNDLPADAWGRPVQMRFANGQVQLHSQGTGAPGQDIVYPAVAVSPAAMTSTVYLNFASQSARRLRATFEFEMLAHRGGRYYLDQVRLQSAVVHDLAPGRAEPESWQSPVGQCTVYVEELPVAPAQDEAKASSRSAASPDSDGSAPSSPGGSIFNIFRRRRAPEPEVGVELEAVHDAKDSKRGAQPFQANRVVQEYSLSLMPGEIRTITVSLP